MPIPSWYLMSQDYSKAAISTVLLNLNIETSLSRLNSIQSSYPYIFYIVLLGVAVAMGIFLWNRELRRQVNLKTIALQNENMQRHEAEQKLELAVEAAGLGTWHWDVATGTLEFNERWAKMLGYELDDVPSNNHEWTALVHPEDIANLDTSSEELIKGKAVSNSIPYRLRTQNGKWKWILSVRKAVSRDADGTALRIAGIHVDIDIIKGRENELNAISKEVIKKNIELEKFAYITSHNLRAPVVNLKSLTDIYEEVNGDEATAKDIFAKIRQSVHRLDATLNDLIEIVSSKGGEKIKREHLHLETEFKAVLESVENQLLEAKANVQYDFSEAENIYFSRRYLHSTLLNLLTNAIKYRSMDKPLEICLRSYPHKDFIYLNFSDNGIGIDLEKYSHKIFGLYQRFHLDRDGKGMGLYIVKSQIEALDGKIKVESEIGKGTTFKILFHNPSA